MGDKKSDRPYPNLIRINERPLAEQKLIMSKGGKGNKDSPKSKLAAKLREMKKRGLTNESAQWMHDMMTDSELAAVQILKELKRIIDETDNPKDRNIAMKTVLDWNRMKHGTNENNKKVIVGHILLTEQEIEEEVVRLLK